MMQHAHFKVIIGLHIDKTILVLQFVPVLLLYEHIGNTVYLWFQHSLRIPGIFCSQWYFLSENPST